MAHTCQDHSSWFIGQQDMSGNSLEVSNFAQQIYVCYFLSDINC
jgi:hypothetical protein